MANSDCQKTQSLNDNKMSISKADMVTAFLFSDFTSVSEELATWRKHHSAHTSWISLKKSMFKRLK